MTTDQAAWLVLVALTAPVWFPAVVFAGATLARLWIWLDEESGLGLRCGQDEPRQASRDAERAALVDAETEAWRLEAARRQQAARALDPAVAERARASMAARARDPEAAARAAARAEANRRQRPAHRIQAEPHKRPARNRPRAS